MNKETKNHCFFCEKDGVEGKKTPLNFSGIWIYKKTCPSCKEYFYSVGAEVHIKSDAAFYEGKVFSSKKPLFLCKAERSFLERELDNLRKGGYQIYWVPK